MKPTGGPDVRLLELRNTYKWGGGPDKTILLSAERHDAQRVAVTVVYVRDLRDADFRIAEKARSRGLTFYEIPESGKFDPRVLRRIRQIVLQHDINLIHAHDYKSDLFAYLVGRSLGRRSPALMSTAHAWVLLGLRGELYRRLDLFLMRRFRQLIAVSHATKREMVAGGVPAEKIMVIHNAIDTEAWSQARVTDDLRQQWRLDDAFPVIGYVGRITPEKDLETWLRAAAIVVREFPKAALVLVGEGRDRTTQEDLGRLAASLGIAANVVFAGYHEHLMPAYATFDAFMLTSRREGLPNSILEAMAMGLPVVTTDVAGARELVVDGETGFVRPQSDFPGLGAALLALARDDRLRSQTARKGRERVEREFSFTRRLARIEDLYERLVRRSALASTIRNQESTRSGI